LNKNNFDWEQYDSLDVSIDNDTEDKIITFKEEVKDSQNKSNDSFDWEQYETISTDTKTNTPTNTPKDLLKASGTVAGRGAISLGAAPFKTIGSILEIFSKLYPETEGIIGLPQRAISNAGRYIREYGEKGEENLKNVLESYLGSSSSGIEESVAETLERIGSIYGSGPFKGMGVPSILGGASGQVAKELGFGEEVQTGAEIVGSAGKSLAKGAKALKSKKIVEKSGLILPRIVDKVKGKKTLFSPKAFKQSKEKLYDKINEQSLKLIKKIKNKSLPLSKQIEKGIDVEGKIQTQLKNVDKISSGLKNEIESTVIHKYLNEAQKKINKVPVPSEVKQEILSLIKKYKKKYSAKKGGYRFYTPKTYVKQFRANNENVRELYKKGLTSSGAEQINEFYQGLNDSITKTLEHGTPESFSKLFKMSNKNYSQLSKIRAFEAVLDTVMTDGIINPKKLTKILSNPKKSKFMNNVLGKTGVENLKLISKDLDKVKNNLKLIDTLGLNNFIKSSSLAYLFKSFGLGKIAIPIQATNKVGQLALGKFLMSPKSTRDFRGFLKALESGKKDVIITALKRLDKTFENDMKTSKEL